ncbi:hypothetical protein ACOMHN_065268 [Nucella lapillus]
MKLTLKSSVVIVLLLACFTQLSRGRSYRHRKALRSNCCFIDLFCYRACFSPVRSWVKGRALNSRVRSVARKVFRDEPSVSLAVLQHLRFTFKDTTEDFNCAGTRIPDIVIIVIGSGSPFTL